MGFSLVGVAITSKSIEALKPTISQRIMSSLSQPAAPAFGASPSSACVRMFEAASVQVVLPPEAHVNVSPVNECIGDSSKLFMYLRRSVSPRSPYP